MAEANGTKPGWKTTEFWLALAATLIGAVVASGALDELGTDHWIPRVIGIVTSVLSALGYGAIRMGVKNSAAKQAALASIANKDPQ